MQEGKTKGTGVLAGVIACVLAILGMLFLAIVFVPLALIVMICGMVIAIKNRNMAGIGVNVLAVVLIIISIIMSPTIILMIFGMTR